MAIFYIDPSASSNGNGTRGNPFNAAPYADYNAGWVGHTFLLKAGTVFNARVQSSATGSIFGAYGKGPKPIWRNGGQDRCLNMAGAVGLQLNHIDFRMSNGVARAVTASTFTQATDRSLTVLGCSFSADDPGLISGSDRIPLFVSGANIKILASHFYNCPSDAAHVQAGDNLEFAYNKVNSGNGIHPNADGLQLESGSAFNVHHNDISINGGIKQALIFNDSAGTSVNGTAEYNRLTLIGDTTGAAINSSVPGAKFRRNIIRAIRAGIVCNRNATVESNLIFTDFDADVNAILAAIAFNSSTITHPVARNNTLIGKNKGRGLSFSQTSGMTNGVFERNIIQGFVEGMYLNMSTGYTQANNWFWNNTTNSNRALAASDRLDNPELNDRYIPQNPLAYRDNGTVYDPIILDMFGNPFVTSTVGCVQPDIVDYDELMMPVYRASADNY